MEPIFTARISTLIAALARAYVPSTLSVASSECPRCGRSFVARVGDGMCEFTLASGLNPPSLSRFRLAAVLTPDGKLSILCACSASDGTTSPIPTR